MGLSLEECERLGIAAEHPDHPSQKATVPKRKVPKVDERGMNKLEAAWDRKLEEMKRMRLIVDFRFEPFKLRLAGRTYYSPDFVVRRNDGSLAILEVKGFMRDDAAVKLKTAAEQFAWLGLFYLVRKNNYGWDIRSVDRRGIGKSNIKDIWT